MNILRKSDKVSNAEGYLLALGQSDFECLKEQVRRNPHKITQLYTHRDVNDPLHEMTIINPLETYIRPHKNTAKPKSFLVLEGAMDVIAFDDECRVTDGTHPAPPAPDCLTTAASTRPASTPCTRVPSTWFFERPPSTPSSLADTDLAPWAAEATAPNTAGYGFTEQIDLAIKRQLFPQFT